MTRGFLAAAALWLAPALSLSANTFAQVGGTRPGNGHTLMIEKKNLEIADFTDKRITKTVR